jgi:hypothetical protein
MFFVDVAVAIFVLLLLPLYPGHKRDDHMIIYAYVYIYTRA